MTERSSDPPNKPSIVGYNYLIEFVGEALIGIRKEIVFHQPAPIRCNSSCFFSLTFQLPRALAHADHRRSEEHTSELQSLMRFSYAVFCLKTKTKHRLNTYYIAYTYTHTRSAYIFKTHTLTTT